MLNFVALLKLNYFQWLPEAFDYAWSACTGQCSLACHKMYKSHANHFISCMIQIL